MTLSEQLTPVFYYVIHTGQLYILCSTTKGTLQYYSTLCPKYMDHNRVHNI